MQNEIRKEIILKAPLEKVWAAISNADEFGQWFGVRFDGPFKAGEKLSGIIVPTSVNDEIAAMQKPYEGTPFNIVVGENHAADAVFFSLASLWRRKRP